MSYFTVNKQLDYDRGFLSGGVYQDGRLRVDGKGEARACFISRLFDSRTPGNEWGRFTLDTRADIGAGLQIGFYASDSDLLLVEGRRVPVQDVISDPKMSAKEKKKIFAPLLQKRFVGHNDMLLNGICGRFLFFILDLFWQETDNSCGDMCLYFPKTSWLKYLPSVYSRDPESADFTERFLGIFQSLYDDRQREIAGSAGLLNPVSCGRALLEELAAWHDLHDIYLWPDEKLKKLILRAPQLGAMQGTIMGLKEYLKLYTGTEPVILEDENDSKRVIISVPERYLTDMREYGLLLRIIGHMLPAGMSARVTPLRQEGKQEKPAAMGVNSVLGHAAGMASDKTSAGGLVLEGGREAEE